MNEKDMAGFQLAGLLRLREHANDEPNLVFQLDQRIKQAELDWDRARKEQDLLFDDTRETVKTAIFASGGTGVCGSHAIKASLAAEILLDYEKMFVIQAIHSERLVAASRGKARRKRGTPEPSLLLTSTPLGSFGFEFSPAPSDDYALQDIHADALKNVSYAITQIATGDDDVMADTVRFLPPKLVSHMRRFFRNMTSHGINIRMAFSSGESETISAESISRANTFLEHEITEETISLQGIFRGLTMDSLSFDLATDGFNVSGRVSEALDDERLEQIQQLTNKRCIAKLHKTTIVKKNRSSITEYELLEAIGTRDHDDVEENTQGAD